MKLQCQQTMLSSRLNDHVRVAAGNPSDLHARTVHLDARKDSLTLTTGQRGGTAKHIRTTIPANVDRQGKATLPVELLSELIAAHPKDAAVDLTLAPEDTHLTITCGNSVAHITKLAVPKPKAPTLQEPQDFELDPDALRNCLGSVLNAASLNSADRPSLNGVHITLADDVLATAATDGFRMSLCSQPATTPEGASLDATIPSDTVRELVRILGHTKAAITISHSEASGRISFSARHDGDMTTVLSSSILEGIFPDVSAHIPQNYISRAVMSPAAAQTAAKIASQFASDNGGAVLLYTSLHTDADGNEHPRITIAARSADQGETTQSFNISLMEGPPSRTALNPKYLLDALQTLRTTEQAAIELTQPRAPAVLRHEGDPENFSHLTLIMPMFIDWDAIDLPAEVPAPTPESIPDLISDSITEFPPGSAPDSEPQPEPATAD